MGVNECASTAEMRRQFQRLITGLMAAEHQCSVEQLRRYLTARERLGNAFEKARKQLNSSEELHGSVTGSGLLLGEILLDAGLITRGQLDEALSEQSKATPPLPLGRILVAGRLLTWEQLAYFLKLQDLLQLPAAHPDRFVRQLLELGLATCAEMEVAMLDCETTGCSLIRAIVRRGWLDASILTLLTGASDKQTGRAPGVAQADQIGSVQSMVSSFETKI